MADRMNRIRIMTPTPEKAAWVDVKPGQWFWTAPGVGSFPCMKTTDGGYVSPANGHHSYNTAPLDVYIVPDGTTLEIHVGMRLPGQGN